RVDHVEPQFVRDVLGDPAAGTAGVVDQDVHRAVSLHGGLHVRPDVLGRGHVTDPAVHLQALVLEGSNRLLQYVLPPGADVGPSAALCQSPGDLQPYSAGGTGHQRHPTNLGHSPSVDTSVWSSETDTPASNSSRTRFEAAESSFPHDDLFRHLR